MTLSVDEKSKIVSANALHATDTGSPEVQVALITSRLDDLQGHFTTHTKDYHSRRGLMKLVGERKKLLNYMRDTNIERYRKLIDKLGLRK